MPSSPTHAFVWVWLPGATKPVVAGRLDAQGAVITFTYGQSYLARRDCMQLYTELPLNGQTQLPRVGEVARCIVDAGPDTWGQRVIMAKHALDKDADSRELGFLTYLLESGSDRIGALDFQESHTHYEPRQADHATLEELATIADVVDQGRALPSDLVLALFQGSAIGGARPKALLVDGNRRLVAKFSSTTDVWPMVKAEFVAMELARRAGLDVAPVQLTRALRKDVLLVERFDRGPNGERKAMVSALTILGLDEFTGARSGSYANLADEIRRNFTNAAETLRELFSRITFNILVSNNDDHPRNHAAFWDGKALTLTPAYDVTPQPRSGGETAQLMSIGRNGYRFSQVAGCLAHADVYNIFNQDDARQIIERQIDVIRSQFDEVCELACVTEAEKSLLQRQFLNPSSLDEF